MRNPTRRNSRENSQRRVRQASDAALRSGFEKLESRVLLAGHLLDDHGHEQLVENFVPDSKFFYEPGGFLSGRSTASPMNIALKYLRTHAQQFGLSADDLDAPIVSSRYVDDLSGITHIYLMQEFNGLGVANGRINVSVMPDGRVLAAGGGFMPGLGALERIAPAPTPQIDPRQALHAIAADLELQGNQPISITSRTSRLDRRQTLNAPEFSTDAITAHLQYIAMPDGTAALGWKMILNMPGGQHWYELTVDSATGKIIDAADYVSHAVSPGTATDPRSTGTGGATTLGGVESSSYNVIVGPTAHPHDPSSATSPNRSIAVNPYDVVASPFGWHDTNGVAGAESNLTIGNNVTAYTDTDNNNAPDAGSQPSGGAELNFDFPLDLTLAPSGYRPAAVTNLFYWNNLIHDVTYRYGFTPVAGNFQTNNYGLGGAQNDPVQAEAQDGGGTNNANFATPADGSRPRMQMYIWTAPNPDRDGDLDNRIIVHEYGHGVSNRLTGGPANSTALSATQSGGMGEGWSDFLSLVFTQKATDTANQKVGVGTYSLGQSNDGKGVRRFPYSYDMLIQPLTFEAYGSGTIVYQTETGPVSVTKSTQVHATGEIWCSTLWDMTWNLINKHGFSSNFAAGYDPGSGNDKGNQLATRLVLDAMKLQPVTPSVIQARDAILAADIALTGGANQLEIWRAFARRGLGVNASTASATSTTITVDFNIPIADPVVLSHTPIGTSLAPISTIDFNFNQPMDQTSFSVVDDVQSFTGPGGTDIKSSITDFTWVAANKLRVQFTPTSARGDYSMLIGPQILALDDGMPMNTDADGTSGEIPDDQYTANFAYQSFLGPEGFGYRSAQFPVETIDLVIGQPGVVTLVNGADDTSSPINLGSNTFNYYGNTFTGTGGATGMFASPNGLVSFGASSTAFTNGNLTSTPSQAVLAVLWDDWRTDGASAPGATDSAVLYKLDGDRLIIEWSDVCNRTQSQGSVTFQAILELNTGSTPGRIIYNYIDLVHDNATYSNGASATVGFKNSGTQSETNPNAHRMLIAQNTNSNAWVQSGSAIVIDQDVVAPTVTASSFNFLTSHTITATFDDNVGASLGNTDLILHNETTNTTVDVAAQLVNYDGGTNTATFTFPGLTDALLPDGDYTATLVSSGITDAAGNPLDGDNNGTIGGNHAFTFFFLQGDANHDRNVNLADFNILAANFGQSPRDFSQGDFTYDGQVNLADFNVLASRFGQSLAPDGSLTTNADAGVRLTPPPQMPATTTGGMSAMLKVGPGATFGDLPIGPGRQDTDELPLLI